MEMTTTVTTDEGQIFIFVAADPCTGECVGIHAAKSGNRFEAPEPICQGVREQFDGLGRHIASGLAIRDDHGSAYMSDDFQGELGFRGMTSSPSFVREPKGNGVAERFIRTLKENLLWIEHFATVAESIAALRAFKRRYNAHWLIGRHVYRTRPRPEQTSSRRLVPRGPSRPVSRSGERGTDGGSHSRSSCTRHRLEASDARPARARDRRSARSPLAPGSVIIIALIRISEQSPKISPALL
jgi:hypothetical protein